MKGVKSVYYFLSEKEQKKKKIYAKEKKVNNTDLDLHLGIPRS